LLSAIGRGAGRGRSLPGHYCSVSQLPWREAFTAALGRGRSIVIIGTDLVQGCTHHRLLTTDSGMQTLFTLAQLADPQVAESEKILRACVHRGFFTAAFPASCVPGDDP